MNYILTVLSICCRYSHCPKDEWLLWPLTFPLVPLWWQHFHLNKINIKHVHTHTHSLSYLQITVSNHLERVQWDYPCCYFCYNFVLPHVFSHTRGVALLVDHLGLGISSVDWHKMWFRHSWSPDNDFYWLFIQPRQQVSILHLSLCWTFIYSGEFHKEQCPLFATTPCSHWQ